MQKLLVTALTLILAAAVTAAQGLGTESYASAHLLSTVQGPSAEAMGRGGAFVAVIDPWSGNPAHVVAGDDQAIIVQHVNYDFSGGFETNLRSVKYLQPLGRNEAIMINIAELDSNFWTIPGTPLKLKMRERDVSILYGRRLDDNWTGGIAVAPMMDVNLTASAGGASIVGIESTPKYGARLGLHGTVDENTALAVQYDWYREESVMRSPGSPALRDRYTSEILRAGAYRQFGRLLVAADYVNGTLETDRGREVADLNGWFVGADYRLNRNLLLRAGSADGEFTCGAEIQLGDIVVKFSKAKNLFADQLALFGDLDATQLTAEISW